MVLIANDINQNTKDEEQRKFWKDLVVAATLIKKKLNDFDEWFKILSVLLKSIYFNSHTQSALKKFTLMKLI